MDDRITELYRSAGVDTEGLDFEVRCRWNDATEEKRFETLKRLSWPKQYSYCRWDRLPAHVQESVLRFVKRSIEDKSNEQERKTQSAGN